MLWILLFVPLLATAATFTVTPTSDSDCADFNCDLQSALNQAEANGQDDTLNVEAGTYIASTTFRYEDIGQQEDFALTINGAGADQTIFSGNNQVRILHIDAQGGANAHVTVQGIQFIAGRSTDNLAAGIHVDTKGDVNVENCWFKSNQGPGAFGGGAGVTSSPFGGGIAVIKNNQFSENQAFRGAGLHLSAPRVSMQGNAFIANTILDTGSGGGAHVSGGSGPVDVSHNTFSNNTGGDGCQGGGLYVSANPMAAPLTVEGNQFAQNVLQNGSSGGGAFVVAVDGLAKVEANIFWLNSVGTSSSNSGGGGLRAAFWGSFADSAFVNNVFRGNTGGAADYGGAVLIESELAQVNFTNNTVTDHVATGGGVVYLKATTTANIYNNIIWGNPAPDLMIRDYGFGVVVNLYNNDIGSSDIPGNVTLSDVGNINRDPNLSGYHILSDASYVVDVGLNSAPGIATDDIDDDARVLVGKAGGDAVVDMGADEYSGTANDCTSDNTCNPECGLGEDVDCTYFRADLALVDAWTENGLLCYQISNVGDFIAPAGSFTGLTIDGQFVSEVAIDQALAPGAQRVDCFEHYHWNCSAPEDRVAICADYRYHMFEANEANNCHIKNWSCDAPEPQIITGPAATNIAPSSATITWATDQACDSLVRYGTIGGKLTHSVAATDLTTGHAIVLPGLLPYTVYQFKVRSTNADGYQVESTARSFQTAAIPDGIDPTLKSLSSTGDGLPLEFTAEAEDAAQIVKVEFFLDGELVETDFSGPFNFYLDPMRLGMTRSEFFAPHSIVARAYDANGNSSDQMVAYQPTLICAIAELDFVLPGDGHVIMSDTGSVPAGNSFDIFVEASESPWTHHSCTECFPPELSNFGNGVERIEVWLDDTTLLAEANETTRLSSSWDPIGLPEGEYNIVAKAFGHDCLVPRTETHQLTVERIRPHVWIARDVTREGNFLRVTLTLRNRSVTSVAANLLQVTDNLVGFHVMPDASAAYTFTRDVDVDTKQVNLTFDFGAGLTIPPGSWLELTYDAVPILYPGFDEYSIGADPVTYAFTDPLGEHYDKSVDRTHDGFPFRNTVHDAFDTADYLLVTNPYNLFAFNLEADVIALLDKTSELAMLKNGVLGYFQAFATFPSSFDRTDKLARGHIFSGHPELVVVVDDEHDRIEMFSMSRRWRISTPDMSVGVELRSDDAIAVGNIYATEFFNLNPHLEDEILIVQGSGTDTGRIIIYQWDQRNNQFDSVYFESTNFEAGDGFAVAELFDDAGHDCRAGDLCPAQAEIVVANANASGTIEIYDNPFWGSWQIEHSFGSVFANGDAFAVGNVIRDDKDELIVAHRTDGFIYLYAADGTLLESYDAGFGADEKMAVGDLVWSNQKDILIIDPDTNRFRILFNAGGSLIMLEDPIYEVPFDDPDGVTIANVQGRAKAQIVTACGRRIEDRAEGDIAIYPEDAVGNDDDRVMLDELLAEEGEWALKMGADPADSTDWASSGYLLIVGETEIIPAWGGQSWRYRDFWAGIDMTFRTTCTDFPYASTTGRETNPELSMARIVGNDARSLSVALNTAVQLHRGSPGYGFDGSHAHLVSAYNRCLHGGCSDVNFGTRRRTVFRKLGDSVNRLNMHFPDFTIYDPPGSDTIDEPATIANIQSSFFGSSPNRDIVFITGHGSPWSLDSGSDENVLHTGPIFSEPPFFGTTNPAVFLSSCLTGRFTGATSLPEAFLYRNAGVFVGATEVSYGWQADIFVNLFDRWNSGESVAAAMKELKQRAGSDPPDRYFSAIYQVYGDAKFGSAGPAGATAAPLNDSGAQPQASDTVYITVPDYVVIETDGTHEVEIPGGQQWCSPGQPAVPLYRAFFDFPAQHVIQDVQLSSRTGLQTDQGVNIPPCAFEFYNEDSGAQPLGADPPPPEWWPRRNFTWETFTNAHGGETLAITIYPLDYNAQTNAVEFYPNWSFAVTYEATEMAYSRLKLARRTYQPGDGVRVAVDLSINSIQPIDVVIDSTILSLDDDPIEGLPLKHLGSVSGLVTFEQEWNSIGVLPGHYIWEMRVLKPDGTLLGKKYASFIIAGASIVISNLDANPLPFHAGEDVTLAATVTNTGSQPGSGIVTLLVQDDNESQLELFEEEFTDLAANSSFDMIRVWQNTALPYHRCRIVAYVTMDGQTSDLYVLEDRKVTPGDVDYNDVVDLTDALKTLRLIAGRQDCEIYPEADVSGDQQIGLAEAIYVIQITAGLRN